MNTVLSTRVDELKYLHPPSSLSPGASVQTVSLADRAALHLGLALITWSRRPRTSTPQPSREQLALRRQAAHARTTREREWQLAFHLSQPRR